MPLESHGTANDLDPDLDVYESYLLVDEHYWHDLLKTSLIARGWVHQERLLSPRILHFGKRELVWECTDLRAAEIFPTGLPKPSISLAEIETPFSYLGGNANQWFQIVQAYSNAALTKPLFDKLPAIAGIAKRVSIERDAKYGAGMFFDDLPRSLLWQCHETQRSDTGPYRAPSWSWASCDGGIKFEMLHRLKNDAVSYTSVENVSLTLTDDRNPFGQVEDGILTLAGPVLRAISYQHGRLGDLELAHPDSRHGLQGSFCSGYGIVFFDGQASKLASKDLHFLFIIHSIKDSCLVLEPMQSYRWKRVGMFRMPEAWSEPEKLSQLKVLPKTIVELI